MGVRKQKALKEKAIAALTALSEDRLKVAVDFLEYLKEKEEWEATWEVMADQEMVAAIEEAQADLRAGKEDQLVPYEEVMQRVRDRLSQDGGTGVGKARRRHG